MWAELLLIVVATAGFAIWQWRDLAREKRRAAERRACPEAGPAPDPDQPLQDATEHSTPTR